MFMPALLSPSLVIMVSWWCMNRSMTMGGVKWMKTDDAGSLSLEIDRVQVAGTLLLPLVVSNDDKQGGGGALAVRGGWKYRYGKARLE
jgi:hypothetical protein